MGLAVTNDFLPDRDPIDWSPDDSPLDVQGVYLGEGAQAIRSWSHVLRPGRARWT